MQTQRRRNVLHLAETNPSPRHTLAQLSTFMQSPTNLALSFSHSLACTAAISNGHTCALIRYRQISDIQNKCVHQGGLDLCANFCYKIWIKSRANTWRCTQTRNQVWNDACVPIHICALNRCSSFRMYVYLWPRRWEVGGQRQGRTCVTTPFCSVSTRKYSLGIY